ncbi:MAG: hypothetical protein AB1757_23145 [Acidobacteriota bacterium]
MFKRRETQAFLTMLFLIITTTFSTNSFAAFAGQKNKASKAAKKEAKNILEKDKKTVAPATTGKPALFEERGDIAALDLYHGIGSEENAPQAPFTFEKEDTSGTNPKVKVTDANGVKWNVKFAEEVHAEIACSRIVWACGYMVEESYFIASGQIKGAKDLGRAKPYIGKDGSFSNAMFEKRATNVARRNKPWSWLSNPFSNTREFSGLLILVMLLNNWDTKDSNNEVLGMYDADGATVREWYIMSDWGASLGKSGSVFKHNKWDLKDYSKHKFIEKVGKKKIDFTYGGVMSGVLEKMPIDHVKWFAGIIGQLSEKQLQEAFKAAGASDDEVTGFAGAVKKRIDELTAAVN